MLEKVWTITGADCLAAGTALSGEAAPSARPALSLLSITVFRVLTWGPGPRELRGSGLLFGDQLCGCRTQKNFRAFHPEYFVQEA